MKNDMTNKTIVIGLGKSGISAINYLYPKAQEEGTEFLSIDSDKETLKHSATPHKIKVGDKIVNGAGCYQNYSLGAACVHSNKRKISNFIKGSVDIIILVSLGGGISSGGIVSLLKLISDQNIYTRVIYTMPFEFEGNIRNNNARKSLKEIKKYANNAIPVEICTDEKISLGELFLMSDKLMARLAIRELHDFC